MTASAPLTDKLIESYLNRLNAALAGMAPLEKSEVLREIRAHIVDSTEHAADRDNPVDRVLGLLGTPEELAERYGTESLFSRASRSFSPWLLLRTCWRWAMLGVKGMVVFFFAVFGYGTALALTVSVFLKPFVRGMGLWLGPVSFHIGVENPSQMRELLGHWFVPVIAVVAFLFAIGTTHALRWMIRTRTPKSAYPTPRTTMCPPLQS